MNTFLACISSNTLLKMSQENGAWNHSVSSNSDIVGLSYAIGFIIDWIRAFTSVERPFHLALIHLSSSLSSFKTTDSSTVVLDSVQSIPSSEGNSPAKSKKSEIPSVYTSAE